MTEELKPRIKEYEDFYIRLRRKIFHWLDERQVPQRVHGWTGNFFQYLALLPDLVYLLIQLLKDRGIHIRYKTMLVMAMTYLIFPLDIIPDFIPVTGYIDDLLVIIVILNRIINTEDQTLIARITAHWPGEDNVLLTVRDIVGVINSLAARIPRGILNFMNKGPRPPRR